MITVHQRGKNAKKKRIAGFSGFHKIAKVTTEKLSLIIHLSGKSRQVGKNQIPGKSPARYRTRKFWCFTARRAFPRNFFANPSTLYRGQKPPNLWDFQKGGFPKGWFWRRFPRNERRNEGTFAKTTLLRAALLISQWKSGKEGFGVKKPPFHPTSEKNPNFPCGALYRNRDFLTRDSLFWGGGKWGFFDSKTLFSWFWGFWPLRRADGFAKKFWYFFFFQSFFGKPALKFREKTKGNN